MKKLFSAALLLCLVAVLAAGCGGGDSKDSSSDDSSKITVLWNLDTEDEVKGFSDDNTGATIAFETTTTYSGAGSMNITPSGTANESKIAANLPSSAIATWNQSTNLVLYLYMPEGMNPIINYVFVGLADISPDSDDNWEWVDGSFYALGSSATGWQICRIGLTSTMKKLDTTKPYKIYISFYHEESGTKTPLDDPFYVDQICLQ